VKIVLDTTILVRANERSHGLARELLLNVVESKHTLLLSNEMLHELARVLRYPRLQAFYDLTENLVFDYVNFLHQAAELVELNPLVASPIRDVNDIIVMQTAIIGEADILCTKDSDFFEDPPGNI
jgi:putative PIN family toxin of toxin-antitoxin system